MSFESFGKKLEKALPTKENLLKFFLILSTYMATAEFASAQKVEVPRFKNDPDAPGFIKGYYSKTVSTEAYPIQFGTNTDRVKQERKESDQAKQSRIAELQREIDQLQQKLNALGEEFEKAVENENQMLETMKIADDLISEIANKQREMNSVSSS